MSDTKDTLPGLREELDTIDTKLHDLIMERTKVTDRVGILKKNMPTKIRPGREAQILFRLMERHTGNFPKEGIAYIWRQIIVSTLQTEGPFSVAVLSTGINRASDSNQSGGDERGLWDLARDHFGANTPMSKHGTALAVVEAVHKKEATLGILPIMQHDDKKPWWRLLVNEKPDTPKIILRLPFIAGTEARRSKNEALVICPVPQEETGRDRSYLAIESDRVLSNREIDKASKETGIPLTFHQVWQDENFPEIRTYFVETQKFISPDGPQLEHLSETLGTGITRIVHLGGYATPLTQEDLAAASPNSE